MYEQISRLQFFFLTYWLVIGTGILLLPVTIGQFVIHDAWMVGLTFILGGAVISFTVHVFVRVFPGQNLFDALQTAFGRWIGRMMGGWIVVWMYVNTCMILREFTLFVTTNFFPNTEIYLIAAVFFVPLIYIVYKGLEVIGRLAVIISPWAIATTVVLSLMALQNARFSNILPVLADGFSPVLRASMVPWMFAANFILALFLVGNVKSPLKTGKNLLITTVAVGITGMFAEAVTTLVLGPVRASVLFPVLEVIRTVRIGYFLERLDPLYVITVSTTMFLNVSVLFYTLLFAVEKLFGCRNYRTYIWGMALAVLSGTLFWMENTGMLLDFIINAAPGFYFVTALGVPLLAIAVQLAKRRFTRTRSGSGQKAGEGMSTARP